jgi:hypothetical protein
MDEKPMGYEDHDSEGAELLYRTRWRKSSYHSENGVICDNFEGVGSSCLGEPYANSFANWKSNGSFNDSINLIES